MIDVVSVTRLEWLEMTHRFSTNLQVIDFFTFSCVKFMDILLKMKSSHFISSVSYYPTLLAANPSGDIVNCVLRMWIMPRDNGLWPQASRVLGSFHDCLSPTVNDHMSSVQNPGWLFDIGDYTTQLYGDYNKPF